MVRITSLVALPVRSVTWSSFLPNPSQQHHIAGRPILHRHRFEGPRSADELRKANCLTFRYASGLGDVSKVLFPNYSPKKSESLISFLE